MRLPEPLRRNLEYDLLTRPTRLLGDAEILSDAEKESIRTRSASGNAELKSAI